ncbi:MAG: DUF6496 domain-containing protein [Polyangiaceae bacterium]
MPERRVRDRARRDAEQGKAPSTQAGEFVREEVHHVREGKHGARSTKQAIAIGLSKARRAGVRLPPPRRGSVPEKTRRSAERAYELGRGTSPRKPAARRTRATTQALKKEGRAAASARALAKQARSAAARRSPAARSKAAKRAAETKGAKVRRDAARKAARTRESRRSGAR